MARARVVRQCWCCCLCCAVALVCVPARSAEAAPPGTAPPGRWQKPVVGPVSRAFDPPRARYGAGHLGVDFRVAAGTTVRAAGAGEVTFAGSIAGAFHVVVAHAGGLRTSYSFLATTAVRRGATVRAGYALGTTGGTGTNHDGGAFHLGLRAGDEYVDPMLLFGTVDLASVVHLAPTTEPFGYSVADERRGLLEGLRGLAADSVGTVVGAAGEATDLVPDVDAIANALQPAADIVRAMGGRYEERIRRVLAGLPPTGLLGGAVTATFVLESYFEQLEHCDHDAPPADGTGGSAHRALLVAGIGSATGRDGRAMALPAERLGYAADEIATFSYSPDGGAYTQRDTYAPILSSARRLTEQLRDQQRIDPGREVDLLAHSQGGVVVLAFLKLVYDPGDPTYPPLGTVITLSSPLDGAPLATVADEIRDVPVIGHAALGAVDGAPGPLPDLDSEAMQDLAVDSEFMARLDAARLPESVEITTIGSLYDLVVPADRATVDGAHHTVVDAGAFDAHGDVLTDDDALMAMRSALEGRPMPCPSLRDVVQSSLVPPAISLVETAAGGFPRTTGFVVPR
ncbi:MAG: peptidoglycan DD-metalloendopeptidase family protein [Acidimicrobiia bacterium]